MSGYLAKNLIWTTYCSRYVMRYRYKSNGENPNVANHLSSYVISIMTWQNVQKPVFTTHTLLD